MHYVHSRPAAPSFKGKGLLGYMFGPLMQKDLDVFYVDVDGGHDTYMISKKISRTYYILSGSGYFTIDRRQYDVSPGMLIEVPPKVEFSYSGRMRLIGFSMPGWAFGNDTHTGWNADVFGEGFNAPVPNGSWRSRVLWWRIFGVSPVAGFLAVNQYLWKISPAAPTSAGPLRRYGEFLHRLARASAKRVPAFSTYFMRNRPALQLIRRFAERKSPGATLRVAVLGCSTGADVYSVAWTIRQARSDVKLAVHAIDLSKEAIDVARRGRYSLKTAVVADTNIFERLTKAEMEAMFDRDGDEVTVKPWLKEGIEWHVADAGGAEVLDLLGPHDIVVASNLLCDMDDPSAEACLRNIGRLAAPGGYVIATGVDLEVRSAVAETLGWSPVQELLEEIHEGDPSLRGLWPCHYAGLEPLNTGRQDWRCRYAAAFQVSPAGERPRDREGHAPATSSAPAVARERAVHHVAERLA
jgi:chemotaxis methyl-accepting protein methylase